jgi:hypothetical protein
VHAFVWKPFKITDLLEEVEKAVSNDVEQRLEGPRPLEESDPDSHGAGEDGKESTAEKPDVPAKETLGLPGPRAGEPDPVVDPVASTDSHDWVRHAPRGHRTRRKNTSRHARRKTWIYLGVITVACLVLASSIALTQHYFSSVDAKEKIRQSLQDQIVKDMVRQKLLEESRDAR